MYKEVGTFCYNPKTGQFIGFESMHVLRCYLGLPNTAIIKSIEKGKPVKGCFVYYDDPEKFRATIERIYKSKMEKIADLRSNVDDNPSLAGNINQEIDWLIETLRAYIMLEKFLRLPDSKYRVAKLNKWITKASTKFIHTKHGKNRNKAP